MNQSLAASNGKTFDGTSASQLFWDRKVLDTSDGIEHLGGIKWDLALALAISWVIVCCCLSRGIKTSGKVIYFAATFPYVILLSLLAASLTQPGAWDGLTRLFTFQVKDLMNFELWQDAASQMFYSLGVAMGGLTMYASYNDFRHNIFRDAYIVSVVDTLTSVVAGMVVFSVVGILSHELHVGMGEVIRGGPGLAFVAYPEALSLLPWPRVWSVLFFAMLYMLGLDSEFAMLESVVASVADEIPFVAKHRTKCTWVFGAVFFACGLVCVTRGGQFVFEILDKYGGGLPLTFLAIFECIGLIWVYGYGNFAFDIDFMLNKKIGFYWKATWKYTAPIFLSIVIATTMCTYKSTKIGDYQFPSWADTLGWMLTLVILLPIPLWAIYEILKQKDAASLVNVSHLLYFQVYLFTLFSFYFSHRKSNSLLMKVKIGARGTRSSENSGGPTKLPSRWPRKQLEFSKHLISQRSFLFNGAMSETVVELNLIYSAICPCVVAIELKLS